MSEFVRVRRDDLAALLEGFERGVYLVAYEPRAAVSGRPVDTSRALAGRDALYRALHGDPDASAKEVTANVDDVTTATPASVLTSGREPAARFDPCSSCCSPHDCERFGVEINGVKYLPPPGDCARYGVCDAAPIPDADLQRAEVPVGELFTSAHDALDAAAVDVALNDVAARAHGERR